jgi:hypothetical protein
VDADVERWQPGSLEIDRLAGCSDNNCRTIARITVLSLKSHKGVRLTLNQSSKPFNLGCELVILTFQRNNPIELRLNDACLSRNNFKLAFAGHGTSILSRLVARNADYTSNETCEDCEAPMTDDTLRLAESVLEEATRAEQSRIKKHRLLQKRQPVTGFDLYYERLLRDGFLPSGPTAMFPNRILTRELCADMQQRIPDLCFSTRIRLGMYFGQEYFRELGVSLWRTTHGNGLAFSRLVKLRQAWEERFGPQEWSNPDQEDWCWNPQRAPANTTSGSAPTPARSLAYK